MSKIRREVMPKIESQRASIREHIDKYKRYPHDRDKEFALDTISRCQERISTLKYQCSQDIPYSWEDTWTP